jgi:hypothetical protein
MTIGITGLTCRTVTSDQARVRCQHRSAARGHRAAFLPDTESQQRKGRQSLEEMT